MPKRNDNMSAMLKEARRAEELAIAKALIVREAAIAAAQTFRHYAQIHRDKGDEAKAARNEDEAVKLTLAIMATANLPDFRALSNQLTADLDTARAEAAALRRQLGELNDSLGVVDIVQIKPMVDGLLSEAAALREEVEAMRAVVEAARDVRDEHMTDEPVMGRVMDRLIEAFRALDALRARKVGG